MKFYFESKYDEVCYNKQYFIDKMKDENTTEIEVFEAEKDKLPKDVFFCKELQLFGAVGREFYPCGMVCPYYQPKNGKSGCCKFYSKLTFSPAKKVTLKI